MTDSELVPKFEECGSNTLLQPSAIVRRFAVEIAAFENNGMALDHYEQHDRQQHDTELVWTDICGFIN